MNGDDERDRTYCLASTAWPRHVWSRNDDDLIDSLNVRIVEGSIDAEFRIDWRDLEHGKPPVPQLLAFEDSWRGLALVMPLFEDLSGTTPQPMEIMRDLGKRGFAPSRYHGQVFQGDLRRDRIEFERLQRLHPEWFIDGNHE